ncbi:MAG: hypothetical protein JWO33_1541, partial [Caulobacteraceae bacterium]|nr:hypothetical protein [Caulobacteraceae bacterium]
MSLKTRFLIACAVAGAALPATAQMRPELPAPGYRSGMPAVNTPPPPVNPNAGNNATSAGFAAWYARAGRPQILLFWNRELIEDGTSQYDKVTSEQGAQIADTDATAVRGRGFAASSASGTAVQAFERREYEERSTNSSYSYRDGIYSKRVESAILSTLLGAGARVIDREAMIRNVSASKSREDRMDIQYLETLAMQKGIQYLIEVLPDNDVSSPTGVRFTVKVTDL